MKDLNWTTIDGKTIPFTELSHQHLSNIVWYFRLFMNIEPHPEIMDMLKDKGLMLYKPTFAYEIVYLFKKKLIRQVHHNWYAVLNKPGGEVIGEIMYSGDLMADIHTKENLFKVQ